MNKTLLGIALASLVTIGCGQQASSTFSAGGTAVSGGANGEAGGLINLEETAPPMIEKGKTVKWVVKADRKDSKSEKKYKGAIRLEFDLSGVKGLKIEPAVIPAGQESVELSITADADFQAGGMIVVTAKGAGTEDYVMRMVPSVR